ncbi:MAG: hypothetical protein MK060_19445 [Blastomonas sp.]|uniref:hypothetical protein n=1 Tax=Blastomonas sp. TaxID=1909299 RepID=UPI003BD75FE2|nr:hypothetical protein [Blastomonas sp.]
MAVAKAEKTATVTSIMERKLRASVIELAEQRRRTWWHRAKVGATQDTVRYPEYWANVARQLNRHDLITILAEDETWEMEACVERVTINGAELSVRKVFKRDPLADGASVVDDIGEFIAERVAGKGWCIRRVKDGHLILEGHEMKASVVAEFHRTRPRKVV